MVWDKETFWRDAGGNFSTVFQHFKANGYRTFGVGKVFHDSLKDPYSGCDGDDWFNTNQIYPTTRYDHSWLAFTKEQELQYPLADAVAANYTIDLLKTCAEPSSPPCFSKYLNDGTMRSPCKAFDVEGLAA